jgi:hypothetical protein
LFDFVAAYSTTFSLFFDEVGKGEVGFGAPETLILLYIDYCCFHTIHLIFAFVNYNAFVFVAGTTSVDRQFMLINPLRY